MESCQLEEIKVKAILKLNFMVYQTQPLNSYGKTMVSK